MNIVVAICIYNIIHTFMQAAPLLDPNVTLTINEYKITWIELQIKWRRHTFPTLYFVHVYSTSINNHESRMTSTYNNSVTWLLPYNSEYNISLVARNCMGSSVPVSIPLTVGEYFLVVLYRYKNVVRPVFPLKLGNRGKYCI